jgi:hypothetical protein
MGGGPSSGKAEDGEDRYAAIYAIFKRFLDRYGDEQEEWTLLEAMMALRAEYALQRAVKGFGMDFAQAVELMKSKNLGLDKQARERRRILLAALDNLVDFAVAEEFQMYDSLPDYGDGETDDEEMTAVFDRYNRQYAKVEDDDIEYALSVAAGWLGYSDTSWLTYMTQGDERVRPWHMALEGMSYPKHSFPEWMIPPIEHGCRCFLVEDSARGGNGDMAGVQGELVMPTPDFANPVFSESICKGGRIFGPAHPYFTIPSGYKKRLKAISKRIKDKWL